MAAEVARHVREGSTGTLFVRSSDNHWGCFVFDNGSIVSLMCRGVRGVRSIRHLRDIGECTFRFDPEAILGEDIGDLPDTREILQQLSGFDDDTPQRAISLSAAQLKQTVCDAAVLILGPVGEILCEEEFARAGIISGMDDLDRLVRRVAREIDDPVQAREFRDSVLGAASSTAGSTTGGRKGLARGSAEYNRIREAIELEASEFLGPVGPMLCEDFFRRYSAGNNVVDVAAVIDSLADEIDDKRLAERFRTRIAERLR